MLYICCTALRMFKCTRTVRSNILVNSERCSFYAVNTRVLIPKISDRKLTWWYRGFTPTIWTSIKLQSFEWHPVSMSLDPNRNSEKKNCQLSRITKMSNCLGLRASKTGEVKLHTVVQWLQCSCYLQVRPCMDKRIYSPRMPSVAVNCTQKKLDATVLRRYCLGE